MQDAANKAAKLVIGHCLKNGNSSVFSPHEAKILMCHPVIFSWNKRQKHGINIGCEKQSKVSANSDS